MLKKFGPIKLRFWPICHPEPADQKYSQSEQKKFGLYLLKAKNSKPWGEENGSINWTKKFLDESKHKKAQFHKSVKYFTQKIDDVGRANGHNYGVSLSWLVN